MATELASSPLGLFPNLLLSLNLEFPAPGTHAHAHARTHTQSLSLSPHLPSLSHVLCGTFHKNGMHSYSSTVHICSVSAPPLEGQLSCSRASACSLLHLQCPEPDTLQRLEEWRILSVTRAEVQKAQGFSGVAQLLWAHMAGGCDTPEGTRRGKVASERPPHRGRRHSPQPGKVFRATQASYGVTEAQRAPSQDPGLSQMPPGDPHSPHPPILPFAAALLNGCLPLPPHLEGPRMLSCWPLLSPPHSNMRIFPACASDHVTTQRKTFRGSLSLGQSPGPPVWHPRLACHHGPPPHPEFLSLPLSHSLWPLGNSTPCDASPLTLSVRFLLFLQPSAQITPPPGSPPGPTRLFRHYPP